MIPVNQTKFSVGGCHGNCLSACMASLLECSVGDIPAWEEMGEDWGDHFYQYLKHVGLIYDGLWVNPGAFIDWWDKLTSMSQGVDGCFIVGGSSPRGSVRGHAVIYKDGFMAHDPHPDRSGLLEMEYVYLISRESHAEKKPT